MQLLHTPAEMLGFADSQRQQAKQIGFVPTLGNLHQGHVKLIKALSGKCDVKVVSIFVNPVQFGAEEDLSAYPRTAEADLAICAAAQVDAVFLPQAADIYGGNQQPLTQVNIPTLASLHCGVSRPTHFMGVLTVVALLFNLVKPSCAAFGRKDFQQLRLVQLMSQELHFPIKIIAVDTGRAADGLALSSRNRYLSASERQLAPQFYQTLQQLASQVTQGARAYRQLEEHATKELQGQGFRPDYVHLARQQDLQPATATDQQLVVLGAVYLGKARLIDNVIVELSY